MSRHCFVRLIPFLSLLFQLVFDVSCISDRETASLITIINHGQNNSEIYPSKTTKDSTNSFALTPSFHVFLGTTSIPATNVLEQKTIEPSGIHATTKLEAHQTSFSAKYSDTSYGFSRASSLVMASSLQRTKALTLWHTSMILNTKQNKQSNQGAGNKKEKKKLKEDKDCPTNCICARTCANEDNRNRIDLRCKTDNLKKFFKRMKIAKENVCSLSLSDSGIESLRTNLFEGFSNLISLNLDGNNLNVLKQNTFQGLDSLLYLSLSNNNLSKWKGNLHNEMPRLSMLNVQGNLKLKMTNELLENTTLQTIVGMSTSQQACTNCNVTRQETTLKSIIKTTNANLNCLYVPVHNQNTFNELFAKFAVFEGSCAVSHRKKCVTYSSSKKSIKELFGDKCRETISSLRAILIILGIFVLIFNGVVILVIVTSSSLREKITFLLITHMAVSDSLIGVYAIAVGDGHKSVYEGTIRSWRKTTCPYFRTVFIFGQILEVATSLLLTTERYLAIVFCMNPSIRLSKRQTVVLLVFSWIFAAVMCFMLQYHDGSIITDNTMCVIVRLLDLHEEASFFISQGLMLTIVAVYIMTIIQYLHIYIIVRQSARTMGSSRPDTSLAFRICLMVMSSFVFLAVPNLIVFIVSAFSIELERQPEQILLNQWIPPTLLVLNACLNPILLAYRNDQFIRALRKLIPRSLRVPNSIRYVIGYVYRNDGFDLDENKTCEDNTEGAVDEQETKL